MESEIQKWLLLIIEGFETSIRDIIVHYFEVGLRKVPLTERRFSKINRRAH